MKILSIDIGIKNLAFCLFDTNDDQKFKITKWDIVNLSEEHTLQCVEIDKNNVCNKPAKFKKENVCYCAKHAKKRSFKIPSPENKPSFINKQKLAKLYEIADNNNIIHTPQIKKTELALLINDHMKNIYFDAVENVNAKDITLYDIGLNIKNKFNCLFNDEIKIDYVIIENQIGPLAIRMKTIQGMIVQYFIMSSLIVEHIEFVSSSNKLKDFNVTDKEKYSDRKKLGISTCLEIITNDPLFIEHISYFNSHKKKDDLADSFLQGLWFINHAIPKKT